MAVNDGARARLILEPAFVRATEAGLFARANCEIPAVPWPRILDCLLRSPSQILLSSRLPHGTIYVVCASPGGRCSQLPGLL